MLGLIIVIPVTFLFLVWFYLFRNNTDIPVSPGAKPIVGHMHHFMDITNENIHLFEQRYSEMTDPTVTGPISHIKFFFQSNFSLNTVTAAEGLFKSTVNINKSFQYDDFAGWLKDSVLILPGKEWKKRRHLLTPAFHFNILDDFSETMKKHAGILIDLLKEDKSLMIVEAIEQATFYSLCETSFGIEFEDVNEAMALHAPMARLIQINIEKSRSQNPLIRYDWFYHRTESGKEWLAELDNMKGMLMKMINKQKQALKDGTTKLHKGKRGFLDQMVWEQEQNGELTDDQMVGECNTILLAGHATTTGTISFAVYYLCEHPEIQERLYQEISDHLAGRDFSEIDVTSLQYLGMVVKEVLRVQPPAGVIARRLSEPMEVAGHKLPTGTNVDISIWWLHRDQEHWDEPEKFDPERFSPENSRNRNPFAFVPFSAGPRNCLGLRFANVESRLFVAALVYNFKMSSDQRLGDTIFRTLHNVAACPGPNFKVNMEPRN